MEVVLSPGRFGDEVPGTPFQNEEIREWSHVDRLTGMLERARVETGRWKTLNQGAARSYGKVIDSRERNSADGSVVQRARRQVEVFQSEGPGRSVQVVRASQWSSSRVTDSSTTSPLALTPLAQKKNCATRLNKSSPSSSLSRDEDISERLSTLLGSFAHHTSSSTVPLRRIDSKYATRTPISLQTSKRSTSNEDLISHSDVLLAATKSLRASNNSSCQKIKDESKASQHIQDSSTNLDVDDSHKVHEISVERQEPRNYTEILRDFENSGDNSQSVIAIDEIRPTTSKAAIQLLPSSKSNKTVVNLINDSGNSQTEATRERPRREARHEESTMPFISGRSVKRVGFCKTEIHFAADSGKVNIVETDGKPPPTNKFRRRRKNSLTGLSSSKNLTIEKLNAVETKDSLRIADDNKTRTDPNLHRGHTTTVNLGSDLSIRNERANRGFPEGREQHLSAAEGHQERNFPGTLEASSQGILLRLENRIYDRLESYSSELLLDSGVSEIPKASTSINIQQTSLKSARLVMNLTRVPGAGCVSKILIDNDVTSGAWSTNLDFRDDDRRNGDESLPAEPRVVSAKKSQQDSGHYLDWQADNEVQCIMLGSSFPKNRSQALQLFSSPPSAKEPENIHENSDTPRIENLAAIETIGESMEKDCSLRLAIIGNESEHEPSKDGCNVVCTDADNNQVLLKVVTIHEPTIARVESDHFRNKIKANSNVPRPVKKERRSNKCFARKSESHKEHTYVNVFTGSKRAPIYENYKIVDPLPIADNKIVAPLTTDDNSVTDKIVDDADTKAQGSQSSSCSVLKSREFDNINFKRVKAAHADGKLSNGTELRCHVEDISQVGNKKARNKPKETKSAEGSSCNTTSHSATPSRGRSGKHLTKNPTSRSSVSSSENGGRLACENIKSCVNNSSASKSTRNAASSKAISKKGDGLTKQKPIEVVYQTAVYNMKNEKLKKPQREKESKGPRYLNELICGAKTKRPNESKNVKASSVIQHAANNKNALQPIKHWK